MRRVHGTAHAGDMRSKKPTNWCVSYWPNGNELDTHSAQLGEYLGLQQIQWQEVTGWYRKGAKVVTTALTRNQVVGGSRHAGTNPALSGIRLNLVNCHSQPVFATT